MSSNSSICFLIMREEQRAVLHKPTGNGLNNCACSSLVVPSVLAVHVLAATQSKKSFKLYIGRRHHAGQFPPKSLCRPGYHQHVRRDTLSLKKSLQICNKMQELFFG